jgi:hypothetical protein
MRCLVSGDNEIATSEFDRASYTIEEKPDIINYE